MEDKWIVPLIIIGIVIGAIIVTLYDKCPEQVNCNLVKNIPDCICEAHYCEPCEQVDCIDEIVNEITKVEADKKILNEVIKK